MIFLAVEHMLASMHVRSFSVLRVSFQIIPQSCVRLAVDVSLISNLRFIAEPLFRCVKLHLNTTASAFSLALKPNGEITGYVRQKSLLAVDDL